MLFGLCMTYNSATEVTEFGRCPYITHYNTTPDEDGSDTRECGSVGRKDLYI